MSSNIYIQRFCQQCGEEFTARTTVTQYCSDRCAKRAYKLRLRDSKIQKSEAESAEIKARPMNEIKAREFLSINQVGTLLGVSRRTVYRMISNGYLKPGTVGKRQIIPRIQIDRLFPQLKD